MLHTILYLNEHLNVLFVLIIWTCFCYGFSPMLVFRSQGRYLSVVSASDFDSVMETNGHIDL